MAHPPPYPDRGDDSGAGPERRNATGAPRWVSVVGITVAIGLLALIIVLHLIGAIGPGAHQGGEATVETSVGAGE